MNEVWKDIKGYEGLYQVSNLGRVKSLKKMITKKNGVTLPIKEKILKNKIKINGYCEVCLYINKKQCFKLIHRLVAETFIPNPEDKPCVDHINTVKDDNRVENLRWCTTKENVNNPLTIEKLSKNTILRKCIKKGKEHHNASAIIQFDLQKNLIRKWDCIADAEREFGNHKRIQECLSNNSRRKTAYNHKWEYYDTDRYLIALMNKNLKEKGIILRKGVA